MLQSTRKSRIGYLSSPRARKLLKWKLPELTIEDLRQQIGSGLSDDELLLQILNPQGEVQEKLDILFGKKFLIIIFHSGLQPAPRTMKMGCHAGAKRSISGWGASFMVYLTSPL